MPTPLLGEMNSVLQEPAHKISKTQHQLTVATMEENPKLSDQGIGNGHLPKSESGDGELADAEDSYSKLRDGHHSIGELADGDNSFGRYWSTIGTILERNVDDGQAQELGL